MTFARLRRRVAKPDLLAALLLLILFALYLYNLTGWYIFDDEGEYLYQVWRMTLGEMPYRDFLTPQLPVFLYAGRLVMEIAGTSLLPMRLYSVLLAFGSGTLIYLLGRRHGGILVGALAMILFLAHPDVFRETRIFRNEPLFLFFVTAGVVVATWSRSGPQRRHLALAGVLFGLATMAKLFGILPAGGVGLWILWEWRTAKRPWSDLIWDALSLTLPLLAVLLVVTTIFTLLVPDFLDLVLGHHLAQGSDLSLLEVLADKARLYARYVSFYPVLVLLALVSAAHGVWQGDVRLRWALQLPTVAAFLVISREFGQRHFMYLLPAFSLLAAWLLTIALRRGRPWITRALSVLLLILFLAPAIHANQYRAQWRDTETAELIALIQERTEPGDTILADDIGLAYYARRPTTYAGAALSHGAVTSGQITGEGLIEEIVADDVRMVLVDTSLLTGNHMVFLRDYPRFHRFLEQNFQYLQTFPRDYQEIDIWWRAPDAAPFDTTDRVAIEVEDGARFGDNMELLGYTYDRHTVQPGETITFTLYWYAHGPAENYWTVFTHLVGPDGALVGQHDKVSYDGVYPPNRWWPGQIIDDDFAITVPADAAAGEYHIAVGMYDWRTNERLSLRDAQGDPVPDNRLRLGQPLQVGP